MNNVAGISIGIPCKLYKSLVFFVGKQFQQYLPLVIGPIMRKASLKPEVALMDNEDMDEVSGGDEWQFVSLGEQQNFGIRTAGE